MTERPDTDDADADDTSRDDPTWLSPALEALDRSNAQDPNVALIHGESLPRELAHARRATHWLDALVPDASPALRLALRAHHLERWLRPRDAYPRDRTGYLRWRKDAQRFHTERMHTLLTPIGVPSETLARASDLIEKKRPQTPVHRAEAQAFEDAVCLVFVERDLAAFAETVSPEKLRGILAKTLPKMSGHAIRTAAGLPMSTAHRTLLLELAASAQDSTAG